MTTGNVAAVDLGASSGRVIVGRVGPSELDLEEVHRFPNEPVRLPDGLHWDVLRLYEEILKGLREAAARADGLASVGIDTWGVDYGLLDGMHALVGNPYHYRDTRTDGIADAVHAVVPADELYRRTGLQYLQFNTIYQLAASRETPTLDAARTLLQIPDLFGYWLSGTIGSEATNASTTALLDVRRGAWDTELMERLRFPALLAPLRPPGQICGPLLAEVRERTDLPETTLLTTVGSHDTASAVVAVPAEDERFAYISCGTWSLVGVELERPVLTEESRAANFTNEGGVDGRIRYLRNVSGLWLLQESLRTWGHAGDNAFLATLLKRAGELPAGGPVFDPDDPVFFHPGDMPARIEQACDEAGQAVPASRAEIVRAIVDSLAATFARTVRSASRLSGRDVAAVHIIGGGARNELLCQFTADACELPVLAGPVEATTIGNVLVQGRAHGFIEGDLEALRAVVRETHEIRRYEPRISGMVPGRDRAAVHPGTAVTPVRSAED